MATSTRPVALITGSGKPRIGNVVAETLAGRGYDIVLHFHRAGTDAQASRERLVAKGASVIALQADFSKEDEIVRLVDQTLEHFGRMDVLVNAAAIWEAKSLEHVTPADVRRHFEINTLATFLCAQRAGLAMTRQDAGGVIINIGDWATVRPYRDYAAYFSSKGSIPALTRSLAVELGSRNPKVRVNCVLPGPVMLPHDLPEIDRRQLIEQTLVKHEGRPENIAHAVLFLIENDFVTGVCLPVDGGRSIYAGGQ